MKLLKKIGSKLSNFWYHYKWRVIIISFFAFIIGICTLQLVQKDEYDVHLMYVGPSYIETDAHHKIEEAFASIIDTDVDGDGKKLANLIDMIILSDEQIKQREEETSENGTAFLYDVSTRNTVIMNTSNYITSGDAIICLLDKYMYDKLASEGAFAQFDELLGYVPENARDGYSIYLKDTQFGTHYSAFDSLPDDTILCMVKMSYMFTSKDQKEFYEIHKEYFKKLIEFSVSQ